MEEQERERRRQVVEKFQKAPFEEIAAHCGARVRKQILCLVLEYSQSSSKIIFGIQLYFFCLFQATLLQSKLNQIFEITIR